MLHDVEIERQREETYKCFLKSPLMNGITGPKDRQLIAKLLANQASALNNNNSFGSTGSLSKFTMPTVRRVFPNLMANDHEESETLAIYVDEYFPGDYSSAMANAIVTVKTVRWALVLLIDEARSVYVREDDLREYKSDGSDQLKTEHIQGLMSVQPMSAPSSLLFYMDSYTGSHNVLDNQDKVE